MDELDYISFFTSRRPALTQSLWVRNSEDDHVSATRSADEAFAVVTEVKTIFQDGYTGSDIPLPFCELSISSELLDLIVHLVRPEGSDHIGATNTHKRPRTLFCPFIYIIRQFTIEG